MSDLTDSLNVLFTEFYYWVTVVMMFLIHVGFATYEVGVSRRKNLQHILIKNIMVIPVVTVTFFLFGWWIYFAFVNGPFLNGGVPRSTGRRASTRGLSLMGPNMGDRITGVFWAAFLLFSWTAASIISGAIIERTKTGAFLIMAVAIGSVIWIIDAAWGWAPERLDGPAHGLPRRLRFGSHPRDRRRRRPRRAGRPRPADRQVRSERRDPELSHRTTSGWRASACCSSTRASGASTPPATSRSSTSGPKPSRSSRRPTST